MRILILLVMLILCACGRIVEPIPCGPDNATASEDFGTHVVYFCKP